MHRAYHALPPMRSPTGVPQHVVYGFISVLIKLFQELRPTHMAVAFDRPGPTFREKLFSAYQQQRPKMDDDFVSQIQPVHDAVAAFGIPYYEADEFEADDVIGTIAKQVIRDKRKVKSKIDQVVIVTGDRDILQLVQDDKVLLFMPTKGISEGKLYGEKDVVERMGVSPNLIIDFKALVGDPSDNYPGVPGIGPKTAVSLLEKFGSLEDVYRGIKGDRGDKGNIGITVKQKLFVGKESAFLGKELATIRTDVPIDVDVDAMKIETLNSSRVIAALEALPFPSLIKRLTGEKKQVISEKTKTLDTQQQLF